MSKNLPALVVAGIAISQDADGRFSLNDLHKAAGGEKRHQPSDFLAINQTVDLIAEINRSGDSRIAPVFTKKGGHNQGTHVCKELVYRYAMWVSPAFELKVIRAYDAMATGSLESLGHLPPAIASQFGGIMKSVVDKRIELALQEVLPQMIHGYLSSQRSTVRDGETSGEIWHRHKIPTYRSGPQMLSHLLCAADCRIVGGGCGSLGGSKAKLFDPDKADDAMTKGGLRDYCMRWVAEKKGQSALFPGKD